MHPRVAIARGIDNAPFPVVSERAVLCELSLVEVDSLACFDGVDEERSDVQVVTVRAALDTRLRR